MREIGDDVLATEMRSAWVRANRLAIHAQYEGALGDHFLFKLLGDMFQDLYRYQRVAYDIDDDKDDQLPVIFTDLSRFLDKVAKGMESDGFSLQDNLEEILELRHAVSNWSEMGERYLENPQGVE